MRRIGRRSAMGMVAALALSACSGTDDGAKTDSPKKRPEKPLKVAVVALADSAALYIAQQRGLFQAEGLTVQPVIVGSTVEGMQHMIGGAIDVVLGDYLSVLAEQEKHVSDFRILADAAQAKPDVYDLVVPKDSPITSIKDLKGKKVSISHPYSIEVMAVDVTLRASGLDSTDVIYVPSAFPDAPAKLMMGQFDASWLTEPFLTLFRNKFGARTVADTMTGPLADFPLYGWTTIQSQLETCPNAMAAFQRAIVKAQHIADTDRTAVEKVLPTYTKTTPEDASAITLSGYPSSLDATRIQRVADTMLQYGYLKTKMDINPLLAPMPK